MCPGSQKIKFKTLSKTIELTIQLSQRKGIKNTTATGTSLKLLFIKSGAKKNRPGLNESGFTKLAKKPSYSISPHLTASLSCCSKVKWDMVSHCPPLRTRLPGALSTLT